MRTLLLDLSERKAINSGELLEGLHSLVCMEEKLGVTAPLETDSQ